MRKPPFGTAHRELLVKLANRGGTWSRRDGAVLYQNRALDDALCQGLVLQGYLDEKLEGTLSVYTLNRTGWDKAQELGAYL